MRLTRPRLFLCLALWALAPLVARAELRLLAPQKTAPDRFAAALAWTPRAMPPDAKVLRRETAWLDGEPVTLVGQPPDWSVESVLLATPERQGDDLSAWSVLLDGAPAGEAVSLEPIQFGAMPGLRVIARGSALPAPRKNPAVITIDGPAGESARQSVADAQALRLLRGAFANGAGIDSVPVFSATTSALPPVPGDFRISYTGGDEILLIDLASAGLNAGDAAGLALTHHGDLLPTGGLIGDSVWLYAPRRRTAWDKTDSLFLTASSATPSPIMEERSAFATLAPQGTEVPLEQMRRFEANARYERFTPLPVGERFLWTGVQYPPSTSNPASTTISLAIGDQLTSPGVTLRLSLYGANTTLSADPDHFADFTLAGEALPRVSWKGQTFHDPEIAHTFAVLPPAGPLILQHTVPSDTPPTASGVDGQRLDWVELAWLGVPRALDGVRRLELPAAAAPRRVTIGGFSPGLAPADIVLLDVTNPASPIRVVLQPAHFFTDGAGGTAIEFEAPAAACVFHAQAVAQFAAPGTVVAAESLPASLAPGTFLRGVYVRPPELAEALTPLVELRGSASLLLLDPQAAYNAFNGGQESPEALRDAVRALLDAHSFRHPFPWLLLAGHASLDHHDYLGLQTAPQVPCFLDESVETEFGTFENPVDYPYALLYGDDLLPDVMLGRIPAKTSAELALAVSRIVQHDALADTLHLSDRPGIFVADADNNFVADNPTWVSKWQQTGNTGLAIHRADYATNTLAFEAIQNAMQASPAGAAFVMYSGHGFNDTWWSSAVMSPALVASIDTDGRWPIVATFTCLNGYYAFPGATSPTLGEAWLFSTDPGTLRGAVANIAPCSADFYLQQSLFAEAVLDGFALPENQRPRSAGELLLRAQTDYATEWPMLEKTLKEYLLFGDPATALGIDPPRSGLPGWAVF